MSRQQRNGGTRRADCADCLTASPPRGLAAQLTAARRRAWRTLPRSQRSCTQRDRHRAAAPPSYEGYLDSQITGTDMYYLEDVELARHLVELG